MTVFLIASVLFRNFRMPVFGSMKRSVNNIGLRDLFDNLSKLKYLQIRQTRRPTYHFLNAGQDDKIYVFNGVCKHICTNI